jgi:uncharacterized protein YukE
VTINPFNPLVATQVAGAPNAWAGVWIVEDIELIEQGVRDGSWIETSLGTVGASLDTLGLMVDPVGTLLQYAAAWVIEHVKPLSEALNWLAGNPAQIVAHAQTWRNVATSLNDNVGDLAAAQRNELPDWSGAAAQTYQTWGTEQRNAISGLAKASATMATITECAGFLIGAVRVMVRDLIATAVSRLIVYAGEELFSVGLATPLVVAQVTSLVASCAAKISRWLKALLASLRRLMSMIGRLGELINELMRILGRLRGPAGHPVTIRFSEGFYRPHFEKKAAQLSRLSDEGRLSKAANPVARDRTVAGNYKSDVIRRVYDQYGARNPEFADALRARVLAMDVDHIHDLQLNGPDIRENLQLLHTPTNQGLGMRQIWPQIRDLPVGTPIRIVVER